MDFSWQASQIVDAIQQTAMEYQRPAILLRPKLNTDGEKWIAQHGENILTSLRGIGASPAEAMADFDKNFYKKKEQQNEPPRQ